MTEDLTPLPNVQHIADMEILRAELAALTPASRYGFELRQKIDKLIDDSLAHRALPSGGDTEATVVQEIDKSLNALPRYRCHPGGMTEMPDGEWVEVNRIAWFVAGALHRAGFGGCPRLASCGFDDCTCHPLAALSATTREP